ncbi:glycosyltransferase [Sphingomonas koreensis]
MPINRVLIENGRTGLLTFDNSIGSYADQTRRLVMNPKERSAIIGAALVKARRFEWAKTLDNVLEAYHGVAARAAHSPQAKESHGWRHGWTRAEHRRGIAAAEIHPISLKKECRWRNVLNRASRQRFHLHWHEPSES